MQSQLTLMRPIGQKKTNDSDLEKPDYHHSSVGKKNGITLAWHDRPFEHLLQTNCITNFPASERTRESVAEIPRRGRGGGGVNDAGDKNKLQKRSTDAALIVDSRKRLSIWHCWICVTTAQCDTPEEYDHRHRHRGVRPIFASWDSFRTFLSSPNVCEPRANILNHEISERSTVQEKEVPS